jgi:hypothetical protein
LLDPASGVKKLGKDVIIKKKFGLRMLILAMLLVSVAFVPAASAKADKASVENNSDSKVETYGIEGLTAQQVSTIESRASYLSKCRILPMMPLIGLCLLLTMRKKGLLIIY